MKKKIHIVFIIGGLYIGGTETQLKLLATKLVEQGFRVTVWTLCSRGPLFNELTSKGISCFGPRRPILGKFLLVHIFKTDFVLNLFRLYRYLRRQRPSIVHTLLPVNNVIGGLIAELAGVKIRITSRRSRNLYQQQQPVLARMEHIVNRRASVVLANSKVVCEDLIGEGVPQSKIRLIYNGIELKRFVGLDRSGNREKNCIDAFELFFVVVANLIPYKGHLDLLKAFSRLSVSGDLPKVWSVNLVGRDDGLADQLRTFAKQENIYGNLRFWGERDDIPEILAMADIGVLTSHEEGFPNTVLEYLAAGLPTIVTDVGDNKELITFKEGIVVEKGNVPEIAKAIATLGSNGQIRERMATNVRLRVERFSADLFCRDYQSLYTSLL